jgi:hypothetical protein
MLKIALIIVCSILVSGVADARKDKKTTVYSVTITNITRGQIISPPIVISHKKDFQLFTLGGSASEGLAALAEDADTTKLEEDLEESGSVYSFNKADGGIPPGESVTVVIETQKGHDLLSAAGMLVTTNDAFFAVRGVKARSKGDMAVEARAYDAGSEFNSELCAYIPGPPCGKHVHDDTTDAEGYVYIHSGIHGMGDLDPAVRDWQNPVATIRIQKVK